MKTHIQPVLTALLAMLLQQQMASGQSYSMDWHKIAGGGGAGAGGNYSIRGTIGQHDASSVGVGGRYSLTGGFWALPLSVPTPGMPTLYITGVGSTVTIYWQDLAGWSLQQNSYLSVPAGWSVASGVSLVNGTNYLTLTNPSGNRFFRLSHP
jgi:hypothetical protein